MLDSDTHTSAEPGPAAARHLPVAAAVGTLAALLALGRLWATGWPFDRLWAEDGAVFLADALDHGWGSLTYSYAGYLHGVPRVIALLGTELPLADVATYTVLASAAVCGLLAAVVSSAARTVTGSVPWACVAGLATVSVPALRFETLGSLANLQWFLLYAALWLCLTAPRALPTALVAGVCAAASLSTPLVVVLAPVLLLHRRDAVRHPAGWALGVGLLVQAAGIASAPESTGRVLERDPGWPPQVGAWFLQGVAGSTGPTPVVATVVGCLVLAAGTAALVTGRAHRGSAIIVTLLGIVLFIGTSCITFAVTGRYLAAGALFLWTGLVLAASSAPRLVAGAVGAVLAVSAVLGSPVIPDAMSGPSWWGELTRATQTCAAPEAPPAVDVPMSPEDWGTMRLECRHLR